MARDRFDRLREGSVKKGGLKPPPRGPRPGAPGPREVQECDDDKNLQRVKAHKKDN